MKLEVLVVPVSDVDRAKRFYENLGFRLDIDYVANEDYRVIQFTPPGSEASIIFGRGITSAQPGSIDRLVLAVSDVHAAHGEHEKRIGVEERETPPPSYQLVGRLAGTFSLGDCDVIPFGAGLSDIDMGIPAKYANLRHWLDRARARSSYRTAEVDSRFTAALLRETPTAAQRSA
jgi:catechol 2,3-dioxygenase-like lactoylglutathione lyase family enzyme